MSADGKGFNKLYYLCNVYILYNVHSVYEITKYTGFHRDCSNKMAASTVKIEDLSEMDDYSLQELLERTQ